MRNAQWMVVTNIRTILPLGATTMDVLWNIAKHKRRPRKMINAFTIANTASCMLVRQGFVWIWFVVVIRVMLVTPEIVWRTVDISLRDGRREGVWVYMEMRLGFVKIIIMGEMRVRHWRVAWLKLCDNLWGKVCVSYDGSLMKVRWRRIVNDETYIKSPKPSLCAFQDLVTKNHLASSSTRWNCSKQSPISTTSYMTTIYNQRLPGMYECRNQSIFPALWHPRLLLFCLPMPQPRLSGAKQIPTTQLSAPSTSA